MLFGVIQKENTKISLEVWVKTFFRRSGSETSSYFQSFGSFTLLSHEHDSELRWTCPVNLFLVG